MSTAQPNFQPVVTDTFADGEPAFTFEPWTDGHAVGFKVTRHEGYFVTVGGKRETGIRHDSEGDAWDEAANVQLQVNMREEVDVEHVTPGVGYVYLNPSQDTWSDGHFNPDVFVYGGLHGDPALDTSWHFYNIEFEEPGNDRLP